MGVLKNVLSSPEPEEGLEFEVWKTIKLGTGLKNAAEFCRILRERRCKISNWANDILGKPEFKVASKEIEVDLVKVTAGELGFKQGARRGQIYERTKELDLDLCPAEVGPQLRLQYMDQPNGEWILIAMEPFLFSGGNLRVFDVERGVSGLWLSVGCGGPDLLWDAGRRWVFVRPRK